VCRFFVPNKIQLLYVYELAIVTLRGANEVLAVIDEDGGISSDKSSCGNDNHGADASIPNRIAGSGCGWRSTVRKNLPKASREQALSKNECCKDGPASVSITKCMFDCVCVNVRIQCWRVHWTCQCRWKRMKISP
jgi:hypothetical protein